MLRISRDLTIDENDIEIGFVRASGPGRQNVNKLSTAAQLRFDTRRVVLAPDVAARLNRLAGQRMTKDGVIVIHAQRSRTQERDPRRRDRPPARTAARSRGAADPAAADRNRPSAQKNAGWKAEQQRRHQGQARRGRVRRLRPLAAGSTGPDRNAARFVPPCNSPLLPPPARNDLKSCHATGDGHKKMARSTHRSGWHFAARCWLLKLQSAQFTPAGCEADRRRGPLQAAMRDLPHQQPSDPPRQGPGWSTSWGARPARPRASAIRRALRKQNSVWDKARLDAWLVDPQADDSRRHDALSSSRSRKSAGRSSLISRSCIRWRSRFTRCSACSMRRARCAYYARAFGLELAERFAFPDFALIYLHHPSSPFELELTVNFDRKTPYELGDGYGHVAFVVDDLRPNMRGSNGRKCHRDRCAI